MPFPTSTTVPVRIRRTHPRTASESSRSRSHSTRRTQSRHPKKHSTSPSSSTMPLPLSPSMEAIESSPQRPAVESVDDPLPNALNPVTSHTDSQGSLFGSPSLSHVHPVPQSLQPYVDDCESEEEDHPQSLIQSRELPEVDIVPTIIQDDEESKSGQGSVISGPVEKVRPSDLAAINTGEVPNELANVRGWPYGPPPGPPPAPPYNHPIPASPYVSPSMPRYNAYPPSHAERRVPVRPDAIDPASARPGFPPATYYGMPPMIPHQAAYTPPHAQHSHDWEPPHPMHSRNSPTSNSQPLERQRSSESRVSQPGETGKPPPIPISAGSHEQPLHVVGNPIVAANDPMNFLARMQSTLTNMAQLSAALPDIQSLVAQYHHSMGELARREDAIRRTAAKQSETLKQKEQHIEMLLKRFEELQRDHAKETSRMRVEIGSLDEKHRSLGDDFKALQEHKERMHNDHKNFISTREAEFDVHRNEMIDGFKSTMRNRELQAEDQKRLMEQQASMERQDLQDAHEASLHAAEERHITKLEDLKQENDELLQRLNLEREEERRKAQEAFGIQQEEMKKAQEAFDIQQDELKRNHESDRDELRAMHDNHVEKLETETERVKAKIEKERNLEKASMYETIVMLKKNLHESHQEKEKLQQLTDSNSETSDLKSKSDLYFTDAFGALRNQVIELSERHFQTVPITSHYNERMLAALPTSLPNFLENSPCASELRSAYVQHVVCNTVHRRIFQPFLFSLQQNHRKADALFTKMSSEMRQKSVKKEATWRQHTLHAAYTASDAKTTTNAIAGDVVDEIISQIESFTEPSQLDSIKIAVRRIVKVAAETWRYARLEREMITAYMGSGDEDGSRGDWQTAKISSPGADGRRDKVILHMMPTIIREPRHTPAKAGEKPAEAVVFLQGKVLYSDSPVVLARLRELQTASRSSPILPAIRDSHVDIPNASHPPIHRKSPENAAIPKSAPVSIPDETLVTASQSQNAEPADARPRQTKKEGGRERSKSRPISPTRYNPPSDLSRLARSSSKRKSILQTDKSPSIDESFIGLDWEADDQDAADWSNHNKASTTSHLSRVPSRKSRVVDLSQVKAHTEVAESW